MYYVLLRVRGVHVQSRTCKKIEEDINLKIILPPPITLSPKTLS
jgi:hypothetical protein